MTRKQESFRMRRSRRLGEVVRIGKASRKGQVSSISGVFERSSKFVFDILVP